MVALELDLSVDGAAECVGVTAKNATNLPEALMEGIMRIQDKVRGMRYLTKGQAIEIPIPARTGYVQLPAELDDADPVKALEKQLAWAKMNKEKATPTKA